DEKGVSRKEESQPAMTIIEESREQALGEEPAFVKIDVLSMFSIPVDTVITNPRHLKYLKVTIEGGDFSDFNIADNYQTILQNNPLLLEIKTPDFIASTKLPINTQLEFLRSTPYIQSDEQEIKKQAKLIIQNENDGLKAVEKILDWVYRNINKRATASLPSALDVLKNKEGDCNEHAILFTALCRAVGIPCQICVGLVYVNNKFYYHAWNKVFLNEWIPVDATFGQIPVDATHIKFAEGELDEQAKVLKIVGKVKMHILAYK
ncbi:MAG: transglutaminase-like domain-containing protein, partial [candidate division WOR-3 bacterium]|nr:transglutaminase-like domain-containing protein [candidate division WOR-3 bacterium]